VNYIIDASVAAKIFIKEDYTEKATDLMKAHIKGKLTLIAPTLIIYELGNIFYKHPHITSEKAYEYITKFLDLQTNLVNIHSNTETLREACTTSKSGKITFYDASYIALAKKLNTKLITADEEIWKKMPEHIILIKDLKL